MLLSHKNKQLRKILRPYKNKMVKIINYLLGIKPKEPYIKVCHNSYANKTILDANSGNLAVGQLLQKNTPLMVTRFGSVELSCIYNYLQLETGKVSRWDKQVVYNMWNNAGFFPNTPKMLERFAEDAIHDLQQVDAMAVWHNEGEKEVVEQYCPHTCFMLLESLDSYLYDMPWSQALQHKKVLVIHPFAKSIESQYKKHQHIFPNKNVLPDFELKVLQAVQSRGKNPVPFASSFEALDYMREQITAQDFDTAIIGAGGYGQALAAFIKKLGKQAIHMGGATQILFGIKGSRWDKMPAFSNLYNEHWVRPLSEEGGGSQGTGWTNKDYW